MYRHDYYNTHKEACCQSSRSWYAHNREHVLRRMETYYKENRTIIRRCQKEWYQRNKHTIKAKRDAYKEAIKQGREYIPPTQDLPRDITIQPSPLLEFDLM